MNAIKTKKQAQAYLADKFLYLGIVDCLRDPARFECQRYSVWTSNPNGGENLIGYGATLEEAVKRLEVLLSHTRFYTALAKTRPYQPISA